MATFRRFIQAIKDYLQKGEAGDIAYLKIELLHIKGNSNSLDKLQDVTDYYPSIELKQLAQLPKGTLGYEYAQHMKQQGIQPLKISPDLLEAAKANPFALRFIATHDIFHVLLGFDTTYAGEVGVLGFTIGQNYSKFLNAYEPIVKYLYPLIFLSQNKQIRNNLSLGKAMGEQAQYLLVYRFEENWSRPIEEIRTELGLLLKDEQLNRDEGNAVDNKSPKIVTA